MARVTTTSAGAGGASVVIQVKGTREAKRMLARWKDPELSIRAQRATMQGAEVLRRPLQAEAGKVSKRMARAVSIRASKKVKPGAFVEFLASKAWFRHLVIGGTRTHGPRRKKALRFRGRFGWVYAERVRGVRPNPIIVRVARAYQRQVFDAMIRSLVRQSEGARR